MIAALVSSYREGPPFLSTIRSAQWAASFILVDDSPIGDAPETGDPTPLELLKHRRNVIVEKVRPAESDAAKRTRMLRRAKTEYNRRRESESSREADPLWVLWLDGDELLMYGELLRDMTYRAEFETGAGGFPIRLVELDGSVAICYGKIIRAEHVDAYEHSSYQVRLTSGMVVALPNVKVCAAGGIPAIPPELMGDLQTRQDELMAVHRPPLIGEPHLLHRSILRSPERGAQRQSEAEGEWFSEILGPDGTVIREIPRG